MQDAWNSLASDTDQRSDRTQKLGAPKSTKGPRSGRAKRPEPLDRRKLTWVIIGSTLVVVLVAVILLFSLGSSTKPDDTSKRPVIPARTLGVNPAGGEQYTSLKAAIDAAQPGDRIVVKGHLLEGDIQMEKKKNITIEVDRGRGIRWKPPTKNFPPPGVKIPKLITIGNCSDCTIKGFIMDGGDTGIAALVNIWGNCPGLTLQDIKLENYLQYGILVNNCEGSTEKPVRLERLSFKAKAGQPQPGAGVSFQIFPGLSVKVNKHITLTDSDFDTSPKVTRPRGMPLDESIKLGAIKVEERQAADKK